EKESMTVSGVLAQSTQSATLRQLCTTSTPVPPTAIGVPKGAKYQSSPSDWIGAATAGVGFFCLKYSMDQPQYYQYWYNTSGSAAQGDSFTAIANGDLNGDGVPSTFQVSGVIGSGMVLNVSPTVAETNPEE